MTNKKYKLGESKQFRGVYLSQIVALRDFADVKAGDVGGWIESERNLSHEGDCWIFNEAIVYELAMVSGNAKVFNEAIVGGQIAVYGQAEVYGRVEVYGHSDLHWNATIKEK